MFGNLRLHGVEMLAVRRNPDGPTSRSRGSPRPTDPLVYFTQSVCNPTEPHEPACGVQGAEAAERHNFIVVRMTSSAIAGEDDARLATLDQLNRVIMRVAFPRRCQAACASVSPARRTSPT
jgi:hypothetical protein